MFRICGVALVAVFCAVILRELGWRGAGVFSAFAGVLILAGAVEGLSSLSSGIAELSSYAEISRSAGDVLKMIAVGYVSGICSDVCFDLGERGISSGVSFVGRIEILVIAFPYFKKILDFGLGLLA